MGDIALLELRLDIGKFLYLCANRAVNGLPEFPVESMLDVVRQIYALLDHLDHAHECPL